MVNSLRCNKDGFCVTEVYKTLNTCIQCHNTFFGDGINCPTCEHTPLLIKAWPNILANELRQAAPLTGMDYCHECNNLAAKYGEPKHIFV